MKKLIILFLLLIIGNSFSQIVPGWYHLNPSTSSWLYSIYFINSLTGFSTGTNGTILYTSDGGANWITRQSGSIYYLYDVVFTSEQIGYIAEYNGHVLKTTNGGLNWTIQTVGGAHMLDGIYFKNDTVGYAVGAQNTSEARIYKTIDGGNNWINISPQGIYSHLHSVFFAADSVGIAVGTDGIVCRTTDAGNSWSFQTIGSSPILSVHFPDSTTGYISGNGIWKTTNRGLNWILQINSSAELWSIRFLNKDTGYAVGGSGSIIKKTTNGGQTWESQISQPPSIFCSDVFPVNKDTAYICGGFGSSGYILKTTNGGISTNVRNLSNEIPSKFSLYQNYPNPFNTSTNIKFQITKTENVKIIVYDLLGKEVAVLVNKKLHAGIYEVRFDGSGLASGLYYCKLEAGDYTEVKKMILIK